MLKAFSTFSAVAVGVSFTTPFDSPRAFATASRSASRMQRDSIAAMALATGRKASNLSRTLKTKSNYGGNAEGQPAAGAPGGEGDRVPDFKDCVGGAEKTTSAKTSRYFRQRVQSGQRCHFSRRQCLLIYADVADCPVQRVIKIVVKAANEQVLRVHLRKAGPGIGTGMHELLVDVMFMPYGLKRRKCLILIIEMLKGVTFLQGV